MKRKITQSIFLIFFLMFSILQSRATVYYVSANGDDNNSGQSPEEAWKTLEKVNSFVPEPGDKILFQRGGIWSGSITLTASGVEGSPIVYGAYGIGDRPVIRGGKELSDWILHTGNIYKAYAENPINQLFVNGERIKISRYPEDYLSIDSVLSNTKICCTGLATTNWTGATAILRLVGWSFEAIKIIESAGDTLWLEREPDYAYAMEAGDIFFIVNETEAINGPGQWAYDENENMVFLWTPNGDSPENYTINTSEENDGFSGHNISYINIQDLNLKAFKSDGIAFTGEVNNIIITNNSFIDNYACGINLYSWGEYYDEVNISNNFIKGSNRCAIRAIGNSFHIINNTINDIGLLENIGIDGFIDSYHAAIGIFLYPVDNSSIIKNKINNTGYNGIMFQGNNNLLEKNRIQSTCKTLNDGGGIYSHLDGTGSVIRKNIISGCGIEGGWFDHGIYLDATAKGVSVENNTCFGNMGNGIVLHECENITVANNIFFCNTNYQAFIGHTRPDLTMNNNIFSYNKMYTIASEEAKNLMIWASDSMDYYTEISNNCYASPDPANIFWAVYNDWEYLTIEEFQETSGQGQNAWRPQVDDYSKTMLLYNETDAEKSYCLNDGEYYDLQGNTISELSLDAFTSKIVIKDTSFYVNQQPVIVDQEFNIQGDLPGATFIGQVVAYDPDPGQSLYYEIASGNLSNMFYIDAYSGQMFLSDSIFAMADMTISLEIRVSDNIPEPDSALANLTINIQSAYVGFQDKQKVFYTLYPNPVSSSFLIRFNKKGCFNVSIYDSGGRLVFRDFVNKESLRINTDSWEKGIGFVEVSDQEGQNYGHRQIVVL